MIIIKELLEETNEILTTKDMFHTIWNYVSNLENLKAIVNQLDYALCGKNIKNIPNSMCSVKAIINTGTSEGVYIDFYLTDLKKNISYILGTFKILNSSLDAYIEMGMLAGALTLAGDNYLFLNDKHFQNL